MLNFPNIKTKRVFLKKIIIIIATPLWLEEELILKQKEEDNERKILQLQFQKRAKTHLSNLMQKADSMSQE